VKSWFLEEKFLFLRL